MKLSNLRIHVVGLGIIGGSIIRALQKYQFNVTGMDLDAATIDYALVNNLINHGTTDETINYSCDLLIIALSPFKTIKYLKENQKYLKSNCLIIDTTGVKQPIIKEIRQFLRPDLTYISTHPMAGREKSGIYNSCANLFQKANLIIINDQLITNNHQELIVELSNHLGFSKITYLSALKHDQLIAFVSQLTHVLAITLMNSNDDEQLNCVTGDSFYDLTRIAKIEEQLWAELFKLNKQELIEQIECFQKALNMFKNSLLNDDQEDMIQLLKQAKKRRLDFEKEE